MRSFCDHGDRSNGNSLVCDIYSDLVANLIHRCYKPGCDGANLVAGPSRGHSNRITTAITQTEAQRDGAHIEVLHLGHRHRLQYFRLGVFHE